MFCKVAVVWGGSGRGRALAGSCLGNRGAGLSQGLRQGLRRFATVALDSGSRGAGRSSVGLGFVGTRGVLGGCKGSGASASRGVRMEAKPGERRCAIITGVARAHGIGRHLVYGFLGQVSIFFSDAWLWV